MPCLTSPRLLDRIHSSSSPRSGRCGILFAHSNLAIVASLVVIGCGSSDPPESMEEDSTSGAESGSPSKSGATGGAASGAPGGRSGSSSGTTGGRSGKSGGSSGASGVPTTSERSGRSGGSGAGPDGGGSGGTGRANGGTGKADGGATGRPDGSTPPTDGGASDARETGGTSNCGVEPVNPRATRQARNLLCYLYSIYGKQVLSGQQETSWSNPAEDIAYYERTVGKQPAILGGDYLYPNQTSERAIAYWNAGGIPMIRYHMGNPPNEDTYQNSMSNADLDAVLREGTREHTSFMSKLDYAARELAKLQAADVPVLWAPFHEAQPGGWFWWSKGTGAQFVAIWRFTFDYLTKTKGLDNLVWLMPFSGSPNSAFYPGKQYADIAGPDTYATDQPFTGIFGRTREVVGNTIPIPLHETGRIVDPARMFPTAAPWVLFSVWAGYQKSHNTEDEIKRTYAHAATITRDEVPNLK